MKCKNCEKETDDFKANFIYDTGECSHWKRALTKKEIKLLEKGGK